MLLFASGDPTDEHGLPKQKDKGCDTNLYLYHVSIVLFLYNKCIT